MVSKAKTPTIEIGSEAHAPDDGPDRSARQIGRMQEASRAASLKGQRANQGGIAPAPAEEPVVSPAEGLVPGMASQSPSFSIPFLSRISPRTKNTLKLVISIALFASLFLFGKVDLSESMRACVGANKAYLAVGLVLFLLAVFVMAHRWQLLAQAVGLPRPFMKMVQLYYVGLFFNMFLPSTVGGDVTRCYYLTKGSNKHLHALTSVLVDRAMGLAMLLLFATAGITFGPGANGLPLQLKLPVFLLTLAMFCLIPFLPSISKRILGEHNWLSRKLNHGTATVFWQDKGLICMSLFLSLVSQVMFVMAHIGVGLALGLDKIPLWYYFVFFPSVAVLGFVTPSVNGIGVREWAYCYFLSLMGVDRSVGLAFALILFGLTTISSLVGGIVYMAGHFKLPPKANAASQGQTEG